MANRKKNQGNKPTGNYDHSLLNATRRGILSRHTVLPWEPREEYDDLHLSLREEYAPIGPIEDHLVEELAGVIWRKRRLRLADAWSAKEIEYTNVNYDWRNDPIVKAYEPELRRAGLLRSYEASSSFPLGGFKKPDPGAWRPKANSIPSPGSSREFLRPGEGLAWIRLMIYNNL
jgi:hypothetical protein